YRLRPNLVWHDDTRLTADDFVFAWRIYSDPELEGLFSATPQNLMEEVVAVDPRTVRISWKRPSPDADHLVLNRFPPLPRHILEAPYQQGPADVVGALPYWS